MLSEMLRRGGRTPARPGVQGGAGGAAPVLSRAVRGSERSLGLPQAGPGGSSCVERASGRSRVLPERLPRALAAPGSTASGAGGLQRSRDELLNQNAHLSRCILFCN